MSRKLVIRALVALVLLFAGLAVLNGIRRGRSLERCWKAGGGWDYRTEECRQ